MEESILITGRWPLTTDHCFMGFLRKLLGVPDADDFAEIMTDALRRKGEAREIRYDRENFKLIIGNDNNIHLWLGNAFAQYTAAPRKMREQVLMRFAQVPDVEAEMIPSLFEEADQSLLPRVRDRAYYGINRLRFEAEEMKLINSPFRLISDHLAVGLAYDRPESIVEVSEDQLAQWDRSFDEAMEKARDNLRNLSGGKFEELVPGVYLSPWHDNHDASRLFLYDLIWHLEVNGQHVAAVPNRDVLVVTGSEDANGLVVMAAICEEMAKQSHAVSAIPVLLEEKSWKTFTLAKDHPAFEAFDKLRIYEEGRNYAEQKKWLEALHSKKDIDLFVASYTVLQEKGTGRLMSYAVWVEDIPTLLPEADEVVFMRQDKKITAKGPFEKVIEVAGDMMSDLDIYPRRYRIDRFPSEKQLEEIGLFPM